MPVNRLGRGTLDISPVGPGRRGHENPIVDAIAGHRLSTECA
jgi:hypothetical protein